MKTIFEIGLLLDFYGQLLTPRQYDILDLHYNKDYSLGEIAEYLGISRQGVYDNLKRGKNTLINYEDNLNLLNKHIKMKTKIENTLDIINRININNITDDDKDNMCIIKRNLKDLLEDI